MELAPLGHLALQASGSWLLSVLWGSCLGNRGDLPFTNITPAFSQKKKGSLEMDEEMEGDDAEGDDAGEEEEGNEEKSA